MPAAAPPHSTAIEAHWLSLFDGVSAATRTALRDVVLAHREAMATAFYAHMLADPDAQPFLTHEAVEQRLHHSLQRWLETLFSCTDREQFGAAMAMQRHVGDVHARVDLPVNIVARGARVLKGQIAHRLLDAGLDGETLVDAVLYADNLIDLAFEEMSSAYVASHERAARIDEAYRVFSYGQNMSLERERQRAALLDWENRFLHEMMAGAPGDELQTLADSSFGLWLQHKASAIFEGSTELPTIHAVIRTVDGSLIPLCQTQLDAPEREEIRRLTKAVQTELGQLKFLADAMFERFVDLESGKDALTQLLNRRFLPAILSREADISRSQGKPFALLLVDVDHFKHINDRHGHDAGDRVLQQIASLLLNTVRSGDFVFRYGGEEFLVLLVEVDELHALRVAEKIRNRVAQESFLLSDGHTLRVTASIGLALHDGHPDYQRLVNRADDALYRAKHDGRNRCVVAHG
ncbi:diguanylate cyclase [Pseudothauera rhizosphaerae]|uniref:Diguanylate cyclase DosC n=1 Tax=Pseudothauera rhizosphaerae TaxID=2565932 RepID=A0A4S4ATU3_9RHOO|nr:diguanylate cyclase [Pseudothauera rhizosphaerae]THF62005.1 diguanylate cyclase [Pseudothauera rhizosphaerae]